MFISDLCAIPTNLAEEPACKVEATLKERLEALSEDLLRTQQAAEAARLQAQQARKARQFAIPSSSTNPNVMDVDEDGRDDGMDVDVDHDDDDAPDDDNDMYIATAMTTASQSTVGSLGVSNLAIKYIPNDWAKLNHRKRAQLTRTVMLLINENVEPLPLRLSPSLSHASKDMVVHMVEETQAKIDKYTLILPEIVVRPSLRLFTLVPVPSFRLRHIHIHHKSLNKILLHFGLGNYNAGGKALPRDGSTHVIFNMFNMTQFHRSAESAFENALGTDGFSTSFTFKHVKPDPPPIVELDKITLEQLRRCRAWSVDPGVDHIFVAADGSSVNTGIYSAAPPTTPPAPAGPTRHRPRSAKEPALMTRAFDLLPSLRERSVSVNPRQSDTSSASTSPRSRREYTTHTAHEIRRMSSVEYNKLAGVPQAKKWLHDRKEEAGIVVIESRLPTAQTARIDRVEERRRFSLYRGKQKANHEMVNIFLGGGRKYGQPTANVYPAPPIHRQQNGAQLNSHAMTLESLH
ncbi:hypothetical protein BC940DRAFT_328548 [Gongronella butleri]|nr:hypothetical protein BC940DRAFT_328548 [Gongronella butleri]